MPDATPEILQDVRATLGEGPVWDPARGVLWWVDIKQRILHAFRPDPSGALSGAPAGQWSLPGQIGCLGLWGADGLILALENGIYGFDPGTGTLTRHGTLEPEAGAIRFNDGKVDPAGRFWAGTLDDTTYSASCIRLRPTAAISAAWTESIVPTASAGRPMRAQCMSPTVCAA